MPCLRRWPAEKCGLEGQLAEEVVQTEVEVGAGNGHPADGFEERVVLGRGGGLGHGLDRTAADRDSAGEYGRVRRSFATCRMPILRLAIPRLTMEREASHAKRLRSGLMSRPEGIRNSERS